MATVARHRGIGRERNGESKCLGRLCSLIVWRGEVGREGMLDVARVLWELRGEGAEEPWEMVKWSCWWNA